MLKAVARSPEKFEDIKNIINMIQDIDIVPVEFMKLYETFQKASKKVRR
jgi:2-iminoacetate synthase ThiH